MAIVLPQGRPAIDMVQGTYERPEPPWEHLDDPAVRACLEPAIAAVGRLESTGSFLGEQLLMDTVDGQTALYVAENVGLPLGMVNRSAPPMLLWRELLKTASTAGVLRGLLEELASNKTYAGIAGQLKAYL